MRARLRPYRSASAPRYSTEDANPNVNATATRFSCAWLVSSAAPMLGQIDVGDAEIDVDDDGAEDQYAQDLP